MQINNLSGMNVFIKDNGENIYKIPIAHGEGRYYADEKHLTNWKQMAR
jgi:phosphoribosylformylglycinamidine (FGAM) synthase-like amidotransferase family enzyme